MDEKHERFLENEKNNSTLWAKGLIKTPFILFDTETTGIGPSDEIVQIAAINSEGMPLLDTLVKPYKKEEWLQAQEVHGISPEDVSSAPSLGELFHTLKSIFTHKIVIAYNVDFDKKMMGQAMRINGLGSEWQFVEKGSTWDCAMKQYAKFNGNWSFYHRSFKWTKLSKACQLEGIEVKDAHDALGDVRMTLELIRGMSDYRIEAGMVEEEERG